MHVEVDVKACVGHGQCEATAPDVYCAAFGLCDVLVNNAGIVMFERLEDVDPAAWDRMVAVNLRGPARATSP